MANFKGGFAFNNEAAKVEVEQAPDGTLISCVNPVTGESLGGGVGEVIFEGEMPFTNTTNLSDYIDIDSMQNNSCYLIIVNNLKVNNHSMDFNNDWQLMYCISVIDDPSAVKFHVKDTNDDYDYDLVFSTTMPPAASVVIEHGIYSVNGIITLIIKVN